MKRPAIYELNAIKLITDALGLQYVEGSVSDAGPAVTDFDTDLTETTDDHYNGCVLLFIEGACLGQAHVINDYDGAAKNVSFSAEDRWTDAPGNGDNFVIIPDVGMMAKAIYSRLGAPAATVSADIAALKLILDTPANFMANLTTLETRLSDARAGYLDQLDFNLQEALNTIAGYIDAEIVAIKDVVDLIPTTSYFEQTVPIKMNCTQTITATKGDKVFIAAGATGASGLISIDDAKVQKVMLLIIGRAVNSYAGTNALDCSAADGTPADNNQWQMDLDSGGFADLTNEAADGQMLDNDWRCPVEGPSHPFTLMFDVDTEITNIDGKIGVQLKDARSEQDSLIVTIDVYLKILWKL